MQRYLRVVSSGFRVPMTQTQLHIILDEFYHHLHELGRIKGDEAVVECKQLVYDYVIKQEWIDE